MKIALTGGTGFIGRYIIRNLIAHSHELNCWYRAESSKLGIDHTSIDWIQGDLSTCETVDELVADCDAVIHNAFWKPGAKFQGEEGDMVEFVGTNLLGAIKLIEASIAAGVKKFVFVSTCAVHDKILSDRKLDEAHPLWPKSHYGAHKAAIEKFVHSYGLGHGFDICAVRPTGVYGVHHQIEESKWFDLVQKVVRGEAVDCLRGGKEVHAADVAESIRLLLNHEETAGESYSCYDRYVSQFEVATLAKELSESSAAISGEIIRPQNQIDNSKIKRTGMRFGGDARLKETIGELVEAVQSEN